MRRFTGPLLTLSLALQAVPARAVEIDYEISGGFDAVVNAFSKAALIFGADSYKSLFALAMIWGIFFGGVAFYGKAFLKKEESLASWWGPVIIGGALFLGTIILPGNGTLHVYDRTTNMYQAIGLPQPMVIVAGLLNRIERGVIDMIYTSGGVNTYDPQANGAGFLGLFYLATTPTFGDPLLQASFDAYANDCLIFEIGRPGTTLSIEELRKTSTDLKVTLGKATNPAVFTSVYDATTPNGAAVSCTEAWEGAGTWAGLKNLLTENAGTGYSELVGQKLKSICQKIGFANSEMAVANGFGDSLGACRASIKNAMDTAQIFDLGAGSASAAKFTLESSIAARLNEIYQSSDAVGNLNYQRGTAVMGSLTSALVWIPYIKAAMTALTISMVPFLFLLLPTPIFGRALGYALGGFVWLALWGMVDAVLHGFTMDYAYKVLENVRSNHMGLDAFLFLPDEVSKIFTMFGSMRMSGMGIATTAAYTLFKVGSAFGSAGQMDSKRLEDGGVKASFHAVDPTQKGTSLTGLARGAAQITMANEYSFNDRVQAEYANQSGSFNQTMGAVEGAGGVDPYKDLKRQHGWQESYKQMGQTSLGRQFIEIAESAGVSKRKAQEMYASFMTPQGAVAAMKGGAAAGLQGDEIVGNFMAQEAWKQQQGVNAFAEEKRHFDDFAREHGMGENEAMRALKAENMTQAMTAMRAFTRNGKFVEEGYRDFLDLNKDKEIGHQRGELQGFAAYKAAGGSGGYRDYVAWGSGYNAVSTTSEIANAVKLSTGGVNIDDNSSVASKAGENRGAITAGQIAAVNQNGGPDALRRLTQDNLSTELKRNQHLRTALGQEFERSAPDSVRYNSEYYKDGRITDAGIDYMLGSAAAAGGFKLATANGERTIRLDGQGRLAASELRETIAAGDKTAGMELVKQLRGSGQTWQAKGLENLINSKDFARQGFDYRANYDKNARISTFDAYVGGQVQDLDKWASDKGHRASFENFSTSTVGNLNTEYDQRVIRKGTDEQNGYFSRTGTSSVDYNEDKSVGLVTQKIDGKDVTGYGELQYTTRPDGTRVLVGGHVANGVGLDVTQYVRGEDGQLHEVQTRGKANSRGHAVNTDSTGQVTTTFAEQGPRGPVMAHREYANNGGGPVMTTARGGKDITEGSRYRGGDRVDIDQNISAGLAASSFTDGASLDPGWKALTSATAGQGFATASEKHSQAGTLIAPLRGQGPLATPTPQPPTTGPISGPAVDSRNRIQKWTDPVVREDEAGRLYTKKGNEIAPPAPPTTAPRPVAQSSSGGGEIDARANHPYMGQSPPASSNPYSHGGGMSGEGSRPPVSGKPAQVARPSKHYTGADHLETDQPNSGKGLAY